MIDLDYSPEVPPAVREMLEFHARRLGLPLEDLERVGQSLDLAEAFLVAAESGEGLSFLQPETVAALPAPAGVLHATPAPAGPEAGA